MDKKNKDLFFFNYLKEVVVLDKLGKYQESIEILDKAIQIYPFIGVHILKVDSLIKLGKHKEATDVIDKVLEIAPNNSDVLIFKEYIEEIEENIWAEEQTGGVVVGRFSADEYLKMIEDGDVCLDESQTIMDGHLETNRLKRKATNLFILDRYKEALDAYNKLLEINPKDEDVLNQKGRSLFSLGKFQEALDTFDRLIEINPKNLHGLTNRVATLTELGKYEEAVSYSDKVLEFDPKNANALSQKGVALLRLRKIHEAFIAFNEALKIDPKHKWALKNKDDILSFLDKDREAISGQTKSFGTYLFFDTETTGLPRNWNAPVNDLSNWPRLVQIAWILCDKNGNYLEERSYIIKPEDFIIPTDASKIHGITTERAEREGISLQKALLEFQDFVAQADFLIAHNMSFDEKIIGAEFLRKSMTNSLVSKKRICTKEKSTNFCAIPSSNGFNDYKWPKLGELYYKLFGKIFNETHDALSDIRATSECFWELKRRGIL